MKITAIKLSVFELPATTSLFDLEQVPYGHCTRWQARGHRRAEAPIHVLHVLTDEGLEGICTVGDARYQTMRREELEALRIMAIGQDPLDREQLDDKLRLLYEAAPLAFVVEQAGGAASNGTQPIMDLRATKLHQRTPLFIGSRDDVATLEQFVCGETH